MRESTKRTEPTAGAGPTPRPRPIATPAPRVTEDGRGPCWYCREQGRRGRPCGACGRGW